MVDVSTERKFQLLALTETKLKGNGEVPWCGVNGINAGVQEMERAREGVAILLIMGMGQILERHGPDSGQSR